MANNKVYTGYWVENVITGASISANFAIFSQQRSMKIKSITIDLNLNCVVGPALGLVAWQNNKDQYFYLKVGDLTKKSGNTFDISSGVNPASNGSVFYITKPETYKFDSFYINETLEFYFKYTNGSAVNNYRPEINIVVEVEQNIIYS